MNAIPENLGRLVETAIEALRTLVSDPATPPSVRLSAVNIILDMTLRRGGESTPPGPSRTSRKRAEHIVVPFPHIDIDNSNTDTGEPVRSASKPGRGLKSRRCYLNKSLVRIDEAAMLLGIPAGKPVPPGGARLN